MRVLLSDVAMRRPFSTQRWPLVLAEPTPAPRTAARLGAVVIGAFLVALAFALEGRLGFGPRLVMALAGVVPLVWAALASRRPAPKHSGTFVSADALGLTRTTPDGEKPIVKWDGPFGVTLLASYGRPIALLAFTTPEHTRYVPTRISERSDVDDELFSRIAVLADLDLVDGITHDAALSSEAAGHLLRAIEKKSHQALGRAYLSDGKGHPIALDRGTLAVADRQFDLTASLEWRPLMFHESTGHAAALYQATWIRQGAFEVVLVAPMPASIVPRDANAQRDANGRLGRALTRDLRLLQAPAENPPARELRVAIDRPFMMAVRRVLDDAPLAARVTPEPPPRPSPERRGSLA